MASKITVGIIGAGRIGTVHARTLAWRVPEAQVVAIADPDAAAVKRLAAEIGVQKALPDYHAILSDPSIQAVVICSSTDTHATIIAEAAKAGKQIFCEKPLDLDLKRIDEVLPVVKKAGVKLMLGFNRRFDPDFARVQQIVASGAIGKPEILRITSRDPSPPPLAYVKVSGGLFLDMTIHDFDMARFVMGEVDEVYVTAANLVDPAIAAAGDVDTALVSLRFASGAVGVIDNSRRAVYGYDQRVEVLGSTGMVANGNHANDTAVISDAKGIHEPLPLNFFMQRYVAAYEAEAKAFVEAIVADHEPPVTGFDGRQAILLGLAARKSVAEGRPVKVAEVDRK